MIKFKVFDNLEGLNTFERSNRVLTINIETTIIGNREYYKLWYRELETKNKK